MKSKNEIKQQITIKQRRLQKRKEQAALFGPSVDPHILIEIEDLETEIGDLQAELTKISPENDTTSIATDPLETLKADDKPYAKTRTRRSFRPSLKILSGLTGMGVVLISSLIYLFSTPTPPTCRTVSSQPGYIRVLASHPEGNNIRLWVGQDGQGLRTFTCPVDSCSEASFSTAQTFLESKTVLAVAWDDTVSQPEKIWVTTSEGVLANLEKQNGDWIQIETFQQKNCPASTIAVLADKLYLGPLDTSQLELYIFDKQQQWSNSTSFTLPESARLQVTSLIYNKETDTIWVGTTVGLYKLSHGQSNALLRPPGIETMFFPVETLAIADKNSIWVGTAEQGLFQFNPVTNEWNFINSLRSRQIFAISLSKQDKLAVIRTESGLGVCSWLDQLKVSCNYIDNPKLYGQVDAISLASNGVILAGVSDKIVVIEKVIFQPNN